MPLSASLSDLAERGRTYDRMSDAEKQAWDAELIATHEAWVAAHPTPYQDFLQRLPGGRPLHLGWHTIFLTLINIGLTIVLWRSLRRTMADQDRRFAA